MAVKRRGQHSTFWVFVCSTLFHFPGGLPFFVADGLGSVCCGYRSRRFGWGSGYFSVCSGGSVGSGGYSTTPARADDSSCLTLIWDPASASNRWWETRVWLWYWVSIGYGNATGVSKIVTGTGYCQRRFHTIKAASYWRLAARRC